MGVVNLIVCVKASICKLPSAIATCNDHDFTSHKDLEKNDFSENRMPDVLKPVAIIQHPDNHVVGYVSAQLNAPTSSLRKHDLDGFRKIENP